MKLVTVPEMLAVEQAADKAGHSYTAMMEAAGSGLGGIVQARFGATHQRLLCLVGRGNNGGDTLIASEFLAQAGWDCACILVSRSRDALVDRAAAAGVRLLAWPGADLAPFAGEFGRAEIVLDGLLGTGIRLPLRAPFDKFLRFAKSELKPGTIVVAVDTPSGVDCSSGAAAPETMRADLTVTMAAAKTGLFSYPAAGYVGELVDVGIGLPEDLEAWRSIRRFVLDEGMVRSWVPLRPPEAHKGTFGTALIAAGSENYVGAALLAGEAAFRSGAGLVTTACPEPVYRMLAGRFAESTWLPLPHTSGSLDAEAAEILRDGMDRATALLVGPGLGASAETRRFMERLLKGLSRPAMVVDADGLRLLAEIEDWPRLLAPGSVLTPHPGEMGALTGLSTAMVQERRLETAEHHARLWGHTLILKGAFTLIASPDGRTALVPVSTAALARAGTGDVLAGLTVGLMAQGLAPFEAAACAAWIHARAGLLAEAKLGSAASVIAGDVVRAIPEAFAELSSRPPP